MVTATDYDLKEEELFGTSISNNKIKNAPIKNHIPNFQTKISQSF